MALKDRLSHNLKNAPEKGDELGYTNRYQKGSKRVITQDGNFNVLRIGERKLLYHELLTMSWFKFFLFIVGFYSVVNLVFATIYILVDFDGIGMTSDFQVHNMFLVALFFSAQTLTTVGYGSLYPLSPTVSGVAASEALVGLMGFAIFTGLMYGRFSKTPHSIRFSKHALISPYKNGSGLMFRAANERNHNLTELEVNVTLALVVNENGKQSRKYYPLNIDNNKIIYFPLNWTMVHPIDEKSPLNGFTKDDFTASEAEILVMIKGYNETSGQDVHARYSYTHEELNWGTKFKIPYYFREDGITVFELDKIDEFESAPIAIATQEVQST